MYARKVADHPMVRFQGDARDVKCDVEKQNVRGNLKLSMETIFKEFSEIESPFLEVVNRVVCDEIEFPLSSASNKDASVGRGGLQ